MHCNYYDSSFSTKMQKAENMLYAPIETDNERNARNFGE